MANPRKEYFRGWGGAMLKDNKQLRVFRDLLKGVNQLQEAAQICVTIISLKIIVKLQNKQKAAINLRRWIKGHST